jgi:hypothetical protein
MLLPDVLLADEDQVTRSEHAGATAPRASSCVSVRQPAALRPHPSSPLPLPAGPRQLELGGLLRLARISKQRIGIWSGQDWLRGGVCSGELESQWPVVAPGDLGRG